MSITLLIVILTCITSIRGFNNSAVIGDFLFVPEYMSRTKQWYRFFSHGLIHQDFIHLAFNMLALYSFGELIEKTFIDFFDIKGRLIYLLMYLSALPISSLFDYFRYRNSGQYAALGASGAVSAVLFSCMLLYPQIGISMFFIPIPIPAYIFGPLYLIITLYLARTNQGRIAHDAHFWGAAYGLGFTTIAFPGVWQHFFEQIF